MDSVCNINSYQLDRQLFQEILCLIQGENGRYFNFDKKNVHQLIKTVECDRLDLRSIGLIRRLATIGNYYNNIVIQTKRFNNQQNDLLGKIFGYALNQQLTNHCQLVTNLHMHSSFSVLYLNSHLWDIMVQFQHLNKIVSVVANYQGIKLLNELYERSINGNPLIRKLMVQIFNVTLKPFVNYLKCWLLQKDLDLLLQNEQFFIVKCKQNKYRLSQHKMVFLNLSLQKSIYKYGIVMGYFLQFASKQEILFIQAKINQLFIDVKLENLNNENKTKLNMDFEYNLHLNYLQINRIILETLKFEDSSLSELIRKIYQFFFSFSDVKCQPIEGDQLKPTRFPLEINNENNRNFVDDVFTKGELTEIETILFDANCQQVYKQIISIFSKLKFYVKSILDCWKQLQCFYTEIRSKWDYDINPIYRVICLKINQLSWILVEKQTETSHIIQIKWEKFQEEIQQQTEILKLKQVHKKFLHAVQQSLQDIFGDYFYKSLEQSIPKLSDQINIFIDKTQQAQEYEIDKWYDEKVQNRNIYTQHLLNLVQFLNEF